MKAAQPRAPLAIVVAIVVVAVLAAGLLAAAPAHATGRQAPGTTAVETTIPPADGSGPHLTGRTEPTALQRVVDSLIWVWVLAVLVLGPLLWLWTGRRRRTGGPDGTDGTAPPGTVRERH